LKQEKLLNNLLNSEKTKKIAYINDWTALHCKSSNGQAIVKLLIDKDKDEDSWIANTHTHSTSTAVAWLKIENNSVNVDKLESKSANNPDKSSYKNEQQTKKGGIKLPSGKYVLPEILSSFTTEKNQKQYGNKKDDDLDKGGAGASGSYQQASNNVTGNEKTTTTSITSQNQSTKQITSKQHQLAVQLQSFQNLTIKAQNLNNKIEIKKNLSFKQIQNQQLDQLQRLTTPNKTKELQPQLSQIKTSVKNPDNNEINKIVTKKSLQTTLVG